MNELCNSCINKKFCKTSQIIFDTQKCQTEEMEHFKITETALDAIADKIMAEVMQ